MGKYPPHNEKHFYKYLPIETAKLILINRKFRYSSPVLFNDPFDVQTELQYDFDINLFHHDFVRKMIELAQSDLDLGYEEKTEFIEAIELLRKAIQRGQNVNPQLITELLEFHKDVNRILEEERINYNGLWEKFLKALRVFSLSTKFDSILMWSHYAQNHSGVVFKLKVLPEEDNLLCMANHVVYQNKPMRFFSKEEIINDILGIQKLPHDKLYSNYAKIKYDLWQYESEWRVWTLEWNHQNKLYSDFNLFPNELEKIIFGCNTIQKDIDEVKSLSKKINSDIKFQKARKVTGEYKLEFEKI